ncbi:MULTISPECIES: preprotein translocase subunit SecA [unclassified Polaromonas]|jgi:preprotein translocase subunit SecA|uniref:preprotein translocase subunit SecA n=1 Tax=unclassified Polaromonas TaxID=2638319 RepID=UPI000BCEE67D|nr:MULTISPECIES: preprotein translocase subunit SecA [unclassified Polaromonas]OYY35926.1 MAG: preprotein translocase subunit SecA [Polaromonas sp. 35-63-35]OYZ19770.1 MAG: preprotein translocase subunit SecA [Polaromonas sp. 16-63-31]OYZ79963.1 MAG: preprotein translocase subunit SecA [Polaromonas sp. 24-63-21]OZA52080.1 MAG: preprotein translocase subunit SecA [Polaromonas sp. 17-63-33]OZA87888.1 MAG: preprotein translocase subunit SecA [Polaromonas sp. 39-63-25]
MASNILTKIFGSRNDRLLKTYRKSIEQINALEAPLEALDDEQLRAKTREFIDRLAKGETLDAILPEAFAVVREGSKRVMKMRHFDVQMLGGMSLHNGKISEMGTGEGKTLTATLPVYLNALTGKGVHVVTVNDYLANRDAQWMGKLYNFLGLTVGINLPNMQRPEKQEAYRADITYGTNNEFGFDYLRDNMVYEVADRVQRGLNYAIVDEVDSILIDEARTPLIISGQAEDHTEMYLAINKVVPLLTRQEGEADPRTGEGIIKPGDFTLDEKTHQVFLTEQGHENAERILFSLGLIPEGATLYDPANISLMHHLYAALRANHIYHRDQHYVVQDGEIVIVDEFTGRLMSGRRWSEGLHQAVEAKEGVEIQAENQTLASITFQNYFRLYGKLAGMTGTADTEAYEFQEIYGLETIVIPPNRPSRREDQLDRVYKTTREKYEAAIKDIRECHERGQPVLVGTTSIENSEIIDQLLDKEKLPHQVLNAKQHAREADIVAQAGRPGMITIATNMAGRGTDIVLGGNVEKQVEAVQAMEDAPKDAKDAEIARLRAEWAQEHEKVKSLGGLRIIATERHESRRIDNQLRGRSGRQGDPGSSRFYLSLDDTLMRIFAGDRVRAIMERLKMPDGEAIEAGIVTRSIESAQRKVEARNFDIRKQLLEYDDVANDQRKVIYQQRNDIMDAASLEGQIASLREGCFTDLVRQYIPAESVEEQWDIAGLEKVLRDEWQMELSLQGDVEAATAITDEDLLEKVIAAANAAFADKVEKIGEENFTQFERIVLLQSIDSHWREHLSSLDYLRQGIHLRGYAQKQPKQEYKREAFELFGQLLDSVKNEVTKLLMTVQVQSGEQLGQAAEEMEDRAERIANVTYTAPTETGEVETTVDEESLRYKQALPDGAVPRVGRNDPCPCGSGKKYKLCHGKLN